MNPVVVVKVEFGSLKCDLQSHNVVQLGKGQPRAKALGVVEVDWKLLMEYREANEKVTEWDSNRKLLGPALNNIMEQGEYFDPRLLRGQLKNRAEKAEADIKHARALGLALLLAKPQREEEGALYNKFLQSIGVALNI